MDPSELTILLVFRYREMILMYQITAIYPVCQVLQEVIVVDKTRLPSNPQQEFSMKTAAHSSVGRASPVPLWRILHFAFLFVEAGSSSLITVWWQLM